MIFPRNSYHFNDVFKRYGRIIIKSSAKSINASNVVLEFGKSFSEHNKNRAAIEYLDRYYRGDQPINYRVKTVRPEINNKIVENHAYEIVEHKTSENFGEPIQYVLRGTDEAKSKAIKALNDYMDSEDKSDSDIELGRWRSICGTSYRFIWNDSTKTKPFDEVPFGFETYDPRFCYVVYSNGNGNRPLYSVQQTKDEQGKDQYFIYTDKEWFIIQNSKIKEQGFNGLRMIPLVEYPNNDRRLSDIEIVITMLDAINKMQSDRMNGVEQFVQAFIKFINCEIDETTFKEMVELGAISVKGQSGNKADVQIMSAELNQQQTQIAKDDLYDNMLIIEGMPDRQENSGGDTGQAVVLRNGFYFSEKRAEINEPIFKKSEREFLRVVLNILSIRSGYKLDLKLSDIEIKVTRSKTDNMAVKAQVLNLLLQSGIAPERATKICNLFSDPEEVCIESKKYLDAKWNPQINKETTQTVQDNATTATKGGDGVE